jgi:prepilin-type processing-associated H-X9-DG protein
VPLTESACAATALWNFTQPRGFSWANGEYRSALYNHYWPANAKQFDCISAVISGDLAQVHSGYGWKTARSWHSEGVNAVFADGSLRFLASETDMPVWRGMATRAGGELSGH